MSRIRIATIVLIMSITAAGTAAVPTLAMAEGRGDPIVGDFNGDGLTDRAYLGLINPDECGLIVYLARRAGGFDRPVAHPYLVPGGGRPVNCPDIGVAVELDPGNPHDEIVIGWFAGPPGGLPYTLIVLREFRVSFTMASPVFAPSFMGTADFNGDGRMDIYEVTDQGMGFVTLLSLGDGALTHGPAEFCGHPMEYVLDDFDLDGAMDVLLHFTMRCDDVSNGVVVVFADGSARYLEWDPLGLRHWRVQRIDADGDGVPDVRTVAPESEAVRIFVNNGHRGFTLAPVANDDVVTVSRDRKTSIPVLANDVVSYTGKVSIVSQPRYGRAQVISNRSIVYIPANPTAGGRDKFIYQVTEEGRSDRAAVSVRFTG